ncbi:MAG: hypothetical protein R2827_09830 [Bdellovibrionales bacterium]
MSSHLLMVGSAPTLTRPMLSREFITSENRYEVLNEQLINTIDGKRVRIHLKGDDELDFISSDASRQCGHLFADPVESARQKSAYLL